jgi:hypothetical protein
MGIVRRTVSPYAAPLRRNMTDVLVDMDGVLQTLAAVLVEAKEEDPHPNPLPRAGEAA